MPLVLTDTFRDNMRMLCRSQKRQHVLPEVILHAALVVHFRRTNPGVKNVTIDWKKPFVAAGMVQQMLELCIKILRGLALHLRLVGHYRRVTCDS